MYYSQLWILKYQRISLYKKFIVSLRKMFHGIFCIQKIYLRGWCFTMHPKYLRIAVLKWSSGSCRWFVNYMLVVTFTVQWLFDWWTTHILMALITWELSIGNVPLAHINLCVRKQITEGIGVSSYPGITWGAFLTHPGHKFISYVIKYMCRYNFKQFFFSLCKTILSAKFVTVELQHLEHLKHQSKKSHVDFLYVL